MREAAIHHGEGVARSAMLRHGEVSAVSSDRLQMLHGSASCWSHDKRSSDAAHRIQQHEGQAEGFHQ
jgi:hypothetical protein